MKSSFILEIDDVSIGFERNGQRVPVVMGVTLALSRGKTLCLVGESGSGKSLSCLAALAILPPGGRVLSGDILFEGRNVRQMSSAELRAYRGGEAAMVFQDPVGALNPAHKIGVQLREAFWLHRPEADWKREALSLLARVGLSAPERVLGAYPHELSGGMNQRVMIAMALASNPKLLIADEPTTALDATIQAQILDLLRDLQEERGLSILMVTHDMGVAAEMADTIVVMQQGRVVDAGTASRVLERPAHPHSRALVAAALSLDTSPETAL